MNTRYNRPILLVVAMTALLQGCAVNPVTGENELSFMSNNGLFEEITEAQLEISVFAAILSQVLLQEKQFCTSLNTGFGCIQLNDSFVQVKGQVINLDLKVRYLEKTDFYLISCQPRMSDSTISIFHNNHAKIQANHLQTS